MSQELPLKTQMLNRIRSKGMSLAVCAGQRKRVGQQKHPELGITLQVLLGHSDIRTTEIYVHANKDKATASKNPLESLLANPQAVVEHRKPEEKPTLRVFAG